MPNQKHNFSIEVEHVRLPRFNSFRSIEEQETTLPTEVVPFLRTGLKADNVKSKSHSSKSSGESFIKNVLPTLRKVFQNRRKHGPEKNLILAFYAMLVYLTT